ncbi:cupin domain-containing protein [Candidatus Bathyarchaeota archaeon]|nr:MAG: cupin domain-containing protein [Candidatus Bathyarchaeota archaeon]
MYIVNVKDLPDEGRVVDESTVGSKKLIIAVRVLKPGEVVEPHKHEVEEQFYLVLSGRGIVKIGDEEREVGPFDAVYIPPGTVHSSEAIGDEPFRYLYVEALG